MILAGMVSSEQDDMSFTGSVRSKSEGAGTSAVVRPRVINISQCH